MSLFDGVIFDPAIFDTGQLPKKHGDYRERKRWLARPRGVNPSK